MLGYVEEKAETNSSLYKNEKLEMYSSSTRSYKSYTSLILNLSHAQRG